MSAVDEGGPAFPSQELNGDGTPYRLNLGMSLRAYIAVHRRMPGDYSVEWATSLVGRPIPTAKEYPDKAEQYRLCSQWWMEAEAAYSVMQADALIAALQAKPAAREFTFRGPVYANVMNYGEAAARVKPAEPKQTMVDAGVRAWHAADSTLLDDRVSAVWKAMAAVAPEPQSSVDIERINRVVQLWSTGVEGSNVAMQHISRIIREHIASNG